MNDEAKVAELRQLFPVIGHWTYLYNGSIHPCPRPVSEAMRAFLAEWENGGEAAFFTAYEAFGRLKEKFANRSPRETGEDLSGRQAAVVQD